MALWAMVGIAVLHGCRTTTPTPPRPTPPSLADRLAQWVTPLKDAGAAVAVLVVDGATGTVLAEERPNELMVPASTQKLLTTAAVLRNLPADHRFTTAVAGPAPLLDGTVEGDLWVVGDGDPGLGSARGLPGAPAQPGPSSTVTEWVAALTRAGVKRVTGSVVGDGRVLPQPSLLPGWAWDDIPYDYSAPPSGLTLNEGVVELQLSEASTPLSAVMVPVTEQVKIRVERVLGEKASLTLLPGAVPGEVLARWQGPPRMKDAREWVAVPDPARFAAEQLTVALRLAGVEVRGRPRAALVDEPPLRAPQIFALTPSMTVRELCGLTNRDSLNMHAEMLLMQVGRLAGTEPTTRGGRVLVEEMLKEAGVDPSGVRMVDGSGLSRMNLLSAHALVSTLHHALKRDAHFADLLAVAGSEGTLRHRLVGTVGEGRVRAKTGSMTGQRNLVGVVDTLRGHRLLFAVLVGGIVVHRTVVDAAVDAMLVELVQGG